MPRYRIGDHVRITSEHPRRGHTGTIKWIGEACGFYLELDDIPELEMEEGDGQLVTWVQHVEFAKEDAACRR